MSAADLRRERDHLQEVNRELLAALQRMLADLREQRDTKLCSRFRDEQIADIAAAIGKAGYRRRRVILGVVRA